MEKFSEYGVTKLFNAVILRGTNDLYDVRIVRETVMEEEVYW